MLGLSSLSCALVLADMLRSNRLRKEQRCSSLSAQLHCTHTSCLDKAARDRLTLYFTQHSRHKVTCAAHRRRGLSQKLNPPGPACPPDRRTPPQAGPHHLHVGDGALCRPFLLSLNHLLHQCTMSSIIGNHVYNTTDTLHGRRLHSFPQLTVTPIDFLA